MRKSRLMIIMRDYFCSKVIHYYFHAFSMQFLFPALSAWFTRSSGLFYPLFSMVDKLSPVVFYPATLPRGDIRFAVWVKVTPLNTLRKKKGVFSFGYPYRCSYDRKRVFPPPFPKIPEKRKKGFSSISCVVFAIRIFKGQKNRDFLSCCVYLGVPASPLGGHLGI